MSTPVRSPDKPGRGYSLAQHSQSQQTQGRELSAPPEKLYVVEESGGRRETSPRPRIMGRSVVVLHLLFFFAGTSLATGRSALGERYRHDRHLAEDNSAARVHVNEEDEDVCWGHPERAVKGSTCGQGGQTCQPGEQCYVSESRNLSVCCLENDAWDVPLSDGTDFIQGDEGYPPTLERTIPVEDLPVECLDRPIHMDVNVLCLAYIPVWYYDTELGECRQGIYGGCQASLNNFSTRDACRDLCVLYDGDVPVSPAAEPEPSSSPFPGGDIEEDALVEGNR